MASPSSDSRSPGNVRRNSGATPGDALILTKGIGVGIYSAAFKKRALPEDAYAEMMASTTLAEPHRPDARRRMTTCTR